MWASGRRFDAVDQACPADCPPAGMRFGALSGRMRIRAKPLACRSRAAATAAGALARIPPLAHAAPPPAPQTERPLMAAAITCPIMDMMFGGHPDACMQPCSHAAAQPRSRAAMQPYATCMAMTDRAAPAHAARRRDPIARSSLGPHACVSRPGLQRGALCARRLAEGARFGRRRWARRRHDSVREGEGRFCAVLQAPAGRPGSTLFGWAACIGGGIDGPPCACMLSMLCLERRREWM